MLSVNGIVALIGWGFVELEGEAFLLGLWVPCEAMLIQVDSANI